MADAPASPNERFRSALSDIAPMSRTSWRKRLDEAVVIILSILAAFAINAWWASRQEHDRARTEVASLRVEFDAADAELARAAAELQVALQATAELARRAGPHAAPLSPDSAARLITRSLTINAVQLPNGALANVLSSGDLPILHDLELQKNLASWPSVSSLLSVKFGYLVSNRDNAVLPVINKLTALSEGLARAFPTIWSDDDRFPFDSRPLLSSREFENLMAGRWINIEIAVMTVADAQKLMRATRADLARWR